mmetsp:Transcript_42818/g.68876  ORF Transcript_42818/g.68876 Transcript_42818/m.68876 type:complete len:130 (-) Transcript_42818:198-587(-)
MGWNHVALKSISNLLRMDSDADFTMSRYTALYCGMMTTSPPCFSPKDERARSSRHPSALNGEKGFEPKSACLSTFLKFSLPLRPPIPATATTAQTRTIAANVAAAALARSLKLGDGGDEEVGASSAGVP